MSFFYFIATLFFAALATASSGDCYFPNGTLVTSPDYVPCNQFQGQFSMCCGTNHTEDGIAADVCLSNGLCKNAGIIWRQSCSDQTWDSPYCLKDVCFNSAIAGGSDDNVSLEKCDDGSYCCWAVSGDSNPGCCSDSSAKRFTLAATIGPASASTLSSSTSTLVTVAIVTTTAPSSTSISSTSISSTSISDNSSSSSRSLSSGAKAGVAVGCVVGVLAVGAGVYFLIRRNNKAQELGKQGAEHNYTGEPIHEADDTSRPVEKGESDYRTYEVAANEVNELEGDQERRPIELPGQEYPNGPWPESTPERQPSE